jgi:HEAT repeat protein
LTRLIEAFETRELDEKIQAAKTIGAIGEKQSLSMLIESMRSDDFEIRYAAIQGLPLAGEKAIIPLMRKLIEHGKEITFRSGAHVVLHQIAAVGFMKILKPVLTALEGPQSDLTAPIAAHEVLERLGQAV